MSTASMINAWGNIQSDKRLTTAAKLILLRIGWKSQEACEYIIRYKTIARELSMSVNGVKQAVKLLMKLRYIKQTGVVVETPKRDHTMTPPEKPKGDHPVTPGGSPSDPLRDHTVTPLHNNKNKKGFSRLKTPKIPNRNLIKAVKASGTWYSRPVNQSEQHQFDLWAKSEIKNGAEAVYA